MNNDVFINNALDTAMKKYFIFKNKKDYSLASDFLVYIICMLIYIYGEADILNPFINKSPNTFLNNLAKYKVDKETIIKLINDISKFYELDNDNKLNNSFKNVFFDYIYEDVIDLYYAKWVNLGLNKAELLSFENLLFTPNNKNEIIKKVYEKYAIDVNASANYFASLVYRTDNVLTVEEIKDNVLDYEIYKVFGLDEKSIAILNQAELTEINKSIYKFFKINPIEVNAKIKLKELAINHYKPSAGFINASGKVNILAFVSFFIIIISIGVVVGMALVGGLF